jgi:5-methylcytosine-specific restriction endonuclease McrA
MGIFCRAAWSDFVIPVKQQSEPTDFDQKVRIPGHNFLQNNPQPQGENAWKGKEYWRKSLRHLYDVNNHICAYTAAWIPEPEGSPTVDHFIPKSVAPDQAYEWSNFRLACKKANEWKGVYQDILDPFQIGDDWFEIAFLLDLEVKPNPNLNAETQKAVLVTIDRLKLNGPECRKGRKTWFNDYCSRNITLSFLERRAPFLAHELKRQNLTQKVIEIWGRVNKNR